MLCFDGSIWRCQQGTENAADEFCGKLAPLFHSGDRFAFKFVEGKLAGYRWKEEDLSKLKESTDE